MFAISRFEFTKYIACINKNRFEIKSLLLDYTTLDFSDPWPPFGASQNVLFFGEAQTKEKLHQIASLKLLFCQL